MSRPSTLARNNAAGNHQPIQVHQPDDSPGQVGWHRAGIVGHPDVFRPASRVTHAGDSSTRPGRVNSTTLATVNHLTVNGPLKGLRVLELARILAGPWAGQVLADLGADVIKIESPDGDPTRQWGPPFIEYADGGRDAAYFHACNRGKRSIIADFTTAEGLRAGARRCASPPMWSSRISACGDLARYGLDAADLARSATRGSSIARSPASARTDPMPTDRATTSSSRRWAGSWI